MSFPALLYTAAAVAFFVLMVMRPAVNVSDTTGNTATTAPMSEQTDGQDAAQTNAQNATQGGGQDSNQPGSEQNTEQSGGQDASQPDSEQNTEQSGGQSTEQTGEQDAGQSGNGQNTEQTGEQDAGQSGNGQNTEQTGEQDAGQASDEQNGDQSGTQNTEPSTSNNSAATTQATNSKPDYARERRIRNQISDAILEGDVLFLHDGSRNFMAIQTAAESARGGAVILHGRGFHPNWEDTVYPLRTGLVEAGWTTLSLQMPVLEKEAKYYDYVPLFPEAGKRISAGIQHLKDQGVSPIVLIAHSCGSHMAMQWIRENGDGDIAAFAGLGMGATDYQQFMSEPLPLDKIQVPVLDVYGENDFPAVIEMAPERWQLTTTAGNPQSEQRVLPAADHYFKDHGDELVALVGNWMNNLRF